DAKAVGVVVPKRVGPRRESFAQARVGAIGDEQCRLVELSQTKLVGKVAFDAAVPGRVLGIEARDEGDRWRMLEVGGLIGGELQHREFMRRLLSQRRNAAIADEARIQPCSTQQVMNKARRRRLALRAGYSNRLGPGVLLEPEIGDRGKVDAASPRLLDLGPIWADAGALDDHVERPGAERLRRLGADQHARLAESRASGGRE